MDTIRSMLSVGHMVRGSVRGISNVKNYFKKNHFEKYCTPAAESKQCFTILTRLFYILLNELWCLPLNYASHCTRVQGLGLG